MVNIMITKELISYIKQAHEAGNAKADTVKTLKEQGWLSADIEAAYQKALSLPSVPSAPQPSSEDTVLLDPGILIRQAITLGKQRFWTLLGIVLFGWTIMSAAILILILIFVFGGIAAGISASANQPGTTAIVIVGVIVGLLAVIGLVILGTWIQAAVITGALRYREKIGVFEAYKQAWEKIGSYFVANFLYGLATLGGFLLFFFPGIIVTVWLFSGIYIVINEGKGPFEALVQARNYTRGRFWSVFGRLLVFWTLQWALLIVAYTLSLFAGEDFQDLVYNLLYSISSLILIPFSFLYIIRLYESLKGSYQPSGDEPKGKGNVLTFIILGIVLPIVYVIGFIALAASLPKEFYEGFKEGLKEEFNTDTPTNNPYEPLPSPYRGNVNEENYF